MGLEAEKFDLSEKLKRQKYDVSHELLIRSVILLSLFKKTK